MFDAVVGGILGRHVRCENCRLEYIIVWYVEKPHWRPKSIRHKAIYYL